MPPPLSLDLRAVNNSSKTIIVNQAIFDVETSVPDREPLLLIKADPRRSRIGYFELMNEGWSTVEDPLLQVQFRPDGSAYPVRLPSFEAAQRVDVRKQLGREGVDWAALEALKWKRRIGTGPTAQIDIEGPDGRAITLIGEEYQQRLIRACGRSRPASLRFLARCHTHGTTAARAASMC